ncbi:MAG: ROK family protein [Chloroflexi bacterium]|nr:ROK family protein [Chloroflexota bacterium]
MYLVFDIGGTNMRLASSTEGEGIAQSVVRPTPQLFDRGIEQFSQLARDLAGGGKFTAAAGGVAGPLGRDKARLVTSNTPDWNGKPLKQMLESAIDARVELENDAALAALGEATAGAGKDKRIVAYMTVGTAVGGARIVDGKIDANAWGFEPGYQIVEPDSGIDISGWAVEVRYGKEPAKISDAAIWEELALRLAYMVNNTIVHWSPDLVVLGGSMILKRPGIPVEKVRTHLRDIFRAFAEVPPLTTAALGDAGGLIGALAFLRQLRAGT